MQYLTCEANDGCTPGLPVLAAPAGGQWPHLAGGRPPLLQNPAAAARLQRQLGLLLAQLRRSLARPLGRRPGPARARGLGEDHGRLPRRAPRGRCPRPGRASPSGDQCDHQPLGKRGEPLIVPVGCSIGAAVLWTYVELFGQHGFGGLVFVDQAPLQDRVPGFVGAASEWGPDRAHLGCYDEASMLAAQRAWIETPDAAHRGLVEGCLGYRVQPLDGEEQSAEYAQKKAADEAFFVGESRRCDGVWLARLLADHTRYDHREAVEAIRVPALVLAGRRTGCFPLAGMEETVRRVRRGNGGREEAAGWVVFESGHWMFWEESERFNEVVGGFARKCMA
ncbi:uncharacterized protein PG986_011709 [Apiospora aurea]|uniref:Uncharacterized protein n=1 Tax=Apiospora aurea TaxID=335848 RepID=A0ABR1PXZ2_9PEZI